MKSIKGLFLSAYQFARILYSPLSSAEADEEKIVNTTMSMTSHARVPMRKARIHQPHPSSVKSRMPLIPKKAQAATAQSFRIEMLGVRGSQTRTAKSRGHATNLKKESLRNHQNRCVADGAPGLCMSLKVLTQKGMRSKNKMLRMVCMRHLSLAVDGNSSGFTVLI